MMQNEPLSTSPVLDLVRISRESLGLVPLHGARLAGFAVLWIAASLGLRLFGLPAALRTLRDSGVIAPALAAMALAAWPLGLLFRVSAPEMLEGQKAVNDAAYLIEQGGPLLWLFTAVRLGSRSLRSASSFTAGRTSSA